MSRCTYSQKSGKLSLDGRVICTGYSGHGEGLNNGALQSRKGEGPIPLGKWHFAGVAKDSDTGPFSILLEPMPGTDALGRSGFRMHGDNRSGDRSASHGCIIALRAAREACWKSGAGFVEVIP